jgi:hypothetical protein
MLGASKIGYERVDLVGAHIADIEILGSARDDEYLALVGEFIGDDEISFQLGDLFGFMKAHLGFSP